MTRPFKPNVNKLEGPSLPYDDCEAIRIMFDGLRSLASMNLQKSSVLCLPLQSCFYCLPMMHEFDGGPILLLYRSSHLFIFVHTSSFGFLDLWIWLECWWQIRHSVGSCHRLVQMCLQIANSHIMMADIPDNAVYVTNMQFCIAIYILIISNWTSYFHLSIYKSCSSFIPLMWAQVVMFPREYVHLLLHSSICFKQLPSLFFGYETVLACVP